METLWDFMVSGVRKLPPPVIVAVKISRDELEKLIKRGPPRDGCPCPYCVKCFDALKERGETLADFIEVGRLRDFKK